MNKYWISLIDLNIKDSGGNTPLHIAIEHNSLDAVEYLLQKWVLKIY